MAQSTLAHLNTADMARLVKIQDHGTDLRGNPWGAVVYRLELHTPNPFYGNTSYTTCYQTRTWTDSGEVWDTQYYRNPSDESVFTSPYDGEPEFYASLEDLKVALGVPVFETDETTR